MTPDRLSRKADALAKSFGDPPAEYKQVAERLGTQGVLGEDEAALFVKMAGCRNRIVHFYDRVSDDDLYELCSSRLTDVEAVLGGLHRWIRDHPDRIDSRVQLDEEAQTAVPVC